MTTDTLQQKLSKLLAEHEGPITAFEAKFLLRALGRKIPAGYLLLAEITGPDRDQWMLEAQGAADTPPSPEPELPAQARESQEAAECVNRPSGLTQEEIDEWERERMIFGPPVKCLAPWAG